MKCDGRRPSCGNCSKRREACQYINEVRRRGPGKRKKLVAARPKKTNKMIESGTDPVPEKRLVRGKGKTRSEFEEGSSQQPEVQEELHLPQSPRSGTHGHPGLIPNANTDLFLPSMLSSESPSRQLTSGQSPPFRPQQFASASFSPPMPYYRSPQGFAPELYPPGQTSPPYIGADVLDPVLTGGENSLEGMMAPGDSSCNTRRASMMSSGPSSSENEARKKSKRSQLTKRARTATRDSSMAGDDGKNDNNVGEAGPSNARGRRHDRRRDEGEEEDELADDEN